jgi:phosphate transport system protein
VVKIDFRKIIGFGNGSYVVSVPKTWINKNKLKKGDLLVIDEGSDELTFSINTEEQKKEEKSITIEAHDKELDRLKTEIVAAYLNNYTTIEIISKKLSTNSIEIKEILRNLAGLEIMEQTSTKIVAKDLININDISIESIIRRVDTIIRGMIDDCIRCIYGEDHYESIFQRDIDVNRLFYLATRVIKNALKNPRVARAFNKDAYQLSTDELIIIRLEKIADRQKRIARYLRGTKMRKETVKELEQLFQDLKKAYYDVMKAYYTNNKKIAFDIEFMNKQRIKNCMSFLERNTGCYLNIDIIKKNKDKKRIETNTCGHIAKIVENLNAMATSIKYISRTVIENE